jgi:hypothetical protein
MWTEDGPKAMQSKQLIPDGLLHPFPASPGRNGHEVSLRSHSEHA